MRAVRCDACGAKAMIAAAKCPACGHLFELRDGFGELLPLSYCSSCESYYPESVGSCRWCGTQPARQPIDPRIWRRSAAGVAAVIGAVWLIQNAASQEKPRTRAQSKTAATSRAGVASKSAAAPLDSDSAMARTVSTTTDSLSAIVAVSGNTARDSVVSLASSGDLARKTDVARAESSAPPPPSRPRGVDSLASAHRVAPPKPTAVASKTPARAARPKSHWVRSVSRHWVVVRAGASREARIVASIGPNSRVELGESRGEWQRVRAKGISGWVGPGSSFEVASVR